MTTKPGSKSAEWRAHPLLPIAAGLGYATSVIHIYSLGAFVGPLGEAFGWSRTQATIGLTISTLIQALFSVPVGLAVDRFGPRRLGVTGVLLTCGAFALLGTATGGVANWALLWVVMAAATLPVQATVWTAAVASRFEASRGLALAVTLCGAGVATAVFPLLATWLIGRYGWQVALPVQAGVWAALTFPIILLRFRGAHDRRRGAAAVERPVLPGTGFAEGLRSSVYIRLLLTSLLFTFTILALVVHFVPILTDRGADPLRAGGIAALIGLASLGGRLATGLLLDRLPGSLVGAGVFLLPALAALLLLTAGGTFAGQAGAAVLVGLTLGAEIDVIVYLTTRHFGLRSFGALYGGLLAALSVGTAFGPLAASAVFDAYGSYVPFLWVAVAFMVASSLALASLPQPGVEGKVKPVPTPPLP